MLSELFAYGGAVAKSKAIKAKQMKENDFEQLIQKKSLAEVVIFLKNNTHYSDIFQNVGDKNLHRGDIENPLKKYYASVVKKYHNFMAGSGKKVVETFFLKEEIEALKDVLRRLESDKERFIAPIDEYIAGHFSIDINKLALAKNINEFIEMLSGSKYEKLIRGYVNSNYGGNKNMFAIEMALDTIYFKTVYKIIDNLRNRRDKKIMKEIIGTEIDLLNIMWIYRCKKYYEVPKEIVFIQLIPYKYKLSKAKLQEMAAAEKFSQLAEIIRTTEYKSMAERIADKDGKMFIETSYEKYFSNMLKRLVKENAFSIAVVIEEIYSVNSEISRIVNIVECIRYGLAVPEIKRVCGRGEI